MNELHTSPRTNELSSRVTKKRGSHPGTTRRTAIYSVLILVIWCGLAIGGYALATSHINKLQAQQAEIESKLLMQIEEVRSENNAKIDDLNAELNALTAKMADVSEKLESIREELQLTSDSITGNDDTKLALQAQISELDKQLEELRVSLRKLEDAARVY